ncbi:unnamed protein product [Urochloa decumbens]|uniref:Importin N-terminal domain-containing protein n=1 Tax=Urochloa decumbens TaxID=240449 RepID=A0ABC9ANK9_9POAL
MSFDITQILLTAQSADGVIRKHAEESLRQFQEENLPGFLLSLSSELANEEKPESRRLAGLILKNSLDAKPMLVSLSLDPKQAPVRWPTQDRQDVILRWLKLDVNTTAQIKKLLLQTLSSTVASARSTASQVIAKVAAIEITHFQGLELIGSLLSSMHQIQPNVKQAALETLGYICEEISQEPVDQDHVNEILTAIVHGMNAYEGNNDVRLAAIRALYNALGFAEVNFSNDMERDHIMSVVCEATKSPEMKIRLAAFDCLVAISSTYYDKLATYMQDIFDITAKAVRGDEESVALQAIEFWSSVCDKEIENLNEYSSEFFLFNDIIEQDLPFIKQALPALVAMLMETLLKQEEVQDLDEGAWNLAMAGGSCLGLVARIVGDDIVPLVMPFVKKNITKSDWRQRDAGICAFGSILDGPSADKLAPLVNIALKSMLSALMKDPSNQVKDTTAWTLGRIFKYLHGSALETSESCQRILTVLLHSMKDAPNVAEKACGALYFIAQGYVDAGSVSPLSPFFQDIVQNLLMVTKREDARESRLRMAAYETLNEVVRCSTEETSPIFMQLVPVIMMELRRTLEADKLTDEREERTELQGLLCGCLQVIIQKLGWMETTKYSFLQYADQMMDLFLRLLASQNATMHEEAMLAIGALAYVVGPNFAKYMAQLYPYLEMGLRNFREYQVYAIFVGVVGDLCMSLEGKILPYCDDIMTQLLSLEDRDLFCFQLRRSIKPLVFSCFGDIALAIGENFEKYLIYAMPMLQSAADNSGHRAINLTDDDFAYTNQLRSGILEAYSGILQGFKSSHKTQILIPYAPHILEFLDALYKALIDDTMKRTALGVLGDLADTLVVHAVTLINQSTSSKEFLEECMASDDPLVEESADWARIAICRAVKASRVGGGALATPLQLHEEETEKRGKRRRRENKGEEGEVPQLLSSILQREVSG